MSYRVDKVLTMLKTVLSSLPRAIVKTAAVLLVFRYRYRIEPNRTEISENRPTLFVWF